MLLALIAAVPAAAQDAPGRVEVGGGLRWLGGTQFSPVAAEETALANVRVVLFNSRSQVDAATGLDTRIGVRLTSLLQVEAALSYTRPTLQTRLTSDREGIPDTTVAETITQYLVEGGVTAQVPWGRVGRLAPFASAGAGYLRQLHQDRQLVETGRTYYVGGGARYPLMLQSRGLVKTAGIRGDVRAAFLTDGVTLDEGTRTVPSLSVSLFVTF